MVYRICLIYQFHLIFSFTLHSQFHFGMALVQLIFRSHSRCSNSSNFKCLNDQFMFGVYFLLISCFADLNCKQTNHVPKHTMSSNILFFSPLYTIFNACAHFVYLFQLPMSNMDS